MFSPYAVTESTPVNQTCIDACTGGTLKILLGQPSERLRLTLRCQHCGAGYTRAADLAGHLIGAHARLWRQAQQLTALLVTMVYSKGTCVCNPQAGQRRQSHICLPLRQLAMLYHRLEGPIFAPHQVGEHALQSMLSPRLSNEVRFSFEQAAAQRNFAHFWMDEALLTVMRSSCLFCGNTFAASALCQHLREAHPGTHPAVFFYIGELVNLMLARFQCDYQCYACKQIFNLPPSLDTEGLPDVRQTLAQSHLLHNCPCILQIALFLTGLLNDGRFRDEPARRLGHSADVGHVQGTGTHVQPGAEWDPVQKCLKLSSKKAHSDGKDAGVLWGVGGKPQGSNLGAGLPHSEHVQGQCSGPLEDAAQPEGRPGTRTPCDDVQMHGVDSDGHHAQAAQFAAEQLGGLDSVQLGTAQTQRSCEGAEQTQDPLVPLPSMTVLMHALCHVRLDNQANWCFANSTIYCLLWALMTAQCEPFHLGERFAALIQFLPCHNLQLVALEGLTWFQQILQTWGIFRGNQRVRQQDSSEFLLAALTWLQSSAIAMAWEKRVTVENQVQVFDHGGPHVPLSLFIPLSFAPLPDSEITLCTLVHAWMQVDGMRTALVQAPLVVCLHLDRLYQDEDGQVHKSECMIDLTADCDIPVFTGQDLRIESVSYVLVACTAHLGDTQGGHYRSILKLRPMISAEGNPISWMMTEDNQPAAPIWRVPDWFRRCATDFWLLRADSVSLHVYQPIDVSHLPVHPFSSTEPVSAPVPVQTDPHVPTPDATEEAILALLQADQISKIPDGC
eukprot:s3424_g2.t1